MSEDTFTLSAQVRTPAPWYGENNGYCSWRIQSNRKTIATVETSAADAQLMAAAPELLEACIHLQESLKQYYSGNTEWDHGMENILLAAIQKAQG